MGGSTDVTGMRLLNVLATVVSGYVMQSGCGGCSWVEYYLSLGRLYC